MSREWKPGDVALVEVGCWANRHRAMFDGSGWQYGDKWVANDPAIVTVDPLVVIDPEDAEQVERLVGLLAEHGWIPRQAHGLQAALREFADPTPRIEEPTGLGAVVEDVGGVRWVRVEPDAGRGTQIHAWRSRVPQAEERFVWWSKINAARVLSEGVTA